MYNLTYVAKLTSYRFTIILFYGNLSTRYGNEYSADRSWISNCIVLVNKKEQLYCMVFNIMK